MRKKQGWVLGATILTTSFMIFTQAFAADTIPNVKKPRVIYPKKTELDFEGVRIEGEIKNPGEFYFQHRPEEKFDSLVKRRKNFHEQMLRDAVLSK